MVTPCSEGNVRPECLMTMQAAVSSSIKEANSPLEAKIDKIYKKVFEGNGTPALVSEVMELRGHIETTKLHTKFQWWFIGFLITGIVGSALATVIFNGNTIVK